MSCSTHKKLCENLVISQSVTFTGGNLVVNLPQATYSDGCKYCIVIAQTIPTTTTISAPVVITIGTDTTQYPLVGCDCNPVLACSINTRTRYSTIVKTDTTSGVFKLLGKVPCSQCANNLASLPITPATTGA